MFGKGVLSGIWTRAAQGFSDFITCNPQRRARGMQETPLFDENSMPGLAVFNGLSFSSMYAEMGLPGIALMAVMTAAGSMTLTAVKSRHDIKEFDRQKKEKDFSTYEAFYKNHGPKSAP
ncbi:MAG TPA: hypothetical protein VIF12_02450 [Micavibrio sp.]|jgi:hypothetical protein